MQEDLRRVMRVRKQNLGNKNLVGSRVEQLRHAAGMRQKELLAQLQVRGISINASGLSKLEGQLRSVSDYELRALAEVFDVPIEAQMDYRARRRVDYEDDLWLYQDVPVYQRLMVMRNVENQRDACYIVTFIPDSNTTSMADCERYMRDENYGYYVVIRRVIKTKSEEGDQIRSF